MAEKKKLSVAEILAAARKLDAGRKQGGAIAGQGVQSEPQSAAGQEQAPAGLTPEAQPTAQEQAVGPQAVVQQPSAESAAVSGAQGGAAAKRSGASAPGGRPSTAEILRMARAGGAAKGGSAPAAAPAARAAEVQAKKAPASAPTGGEAKAAKGPAAAVKSAAAPGAEPKASVGSAAGTAASGKTGPSTAAEKETASFLTPHRPAKRGPISKAEAAARQAGGAAEPQSKVEAARGKLDRQKAAVVPPMPPKPAYAQPKAAAPAPEGETRRGFLLRVVTATVGSFLAIGFSTLTASLTLWTLGVARYMFPNVLTEPPSRFKVGFPSDFPPGFVDERFKAQFGVWVVNGEYQGQRQIYALRTVCTHLGCTPNWLEAEQKFKCPCHGSGFYKDGVNFEGPAPRPLERYAIRLADDGQLEIDKSKLFQEELGQWSDPASYVSV